MATIFLSYSNRDTRNVRAMADNLLNARVQVWLDENLRGGESWWSTVLQQIRDCEVFVFALSNSSWVSEPCRLELGYAQALGKPVLPVRVGAADNLRSMDVASYQIIDYVHESTAGAFAQLGAVHDARSKARPLIAELPPEPPIPYGYLLRLGRAVDARQISSSEQRQLVTSLQDALDRETDDGVRADVVGLLRRLRARDDVTHKVAGDIEEILERPVARRAAKSVRSAPVGVATSRAGARRYAVPRGAHLVTTCLLIAIAIMTTYIAVQFSAEFLALLLSIAVGPLLPVVAVWGLAVAPSRPRLGFTLAAVTTTLSGVIAAFAVFLFALVIEFFSGVNRLFGAADTDTSDDLVTLGFVVVWLVLATVSATLLWSRGLRRS